MSDIVLRLREEAMLIVATHEYIAHTMLDAATMIERLRARVVDGIEACACPACGGALVLVTRPLCQCSSWPQKGTPYPVIPQPPGDSPCEN